MNDNGYISKRYILSFILIFCLLLLFLFMFFYFNLYLVIVLLIVIAICILFMFLTNKEKKQDEEDIIDEDDIEDKVRKRDEKFSLEVFHLYVKEVLELVGRAYSKNNTSILTNFVGRELINEINTNIEEYKKSDYTRMITSINMRDCKITDYYIKSGYEYFIVEASVSKIDCEVQNGVVISGAPTNGKFLDYELTICRNIKEYIPVNVVNCPSCGSTSDSINDGKCLNCGLLVINTDGFYLIKIDK